MKSKIIVKNQEISIVQNDYIYHNQNFKLTEFDRFRKVAIEQLKLLAYYSKKKLEKQ